MVCFGSFGASLLRVLKKKKKRKAKTNCFAALRKCLLHSVHSFCPFARGRLSVHLNIQRSCVGWLCECWVCALNSASLCIVVAVRETFCYKVMFELVSLLCLLQIFCSFSTSGVKRLVLLRKDVNVKPERSLPPPSLLSSVLGCQCRQPGRDGGLCFLGWGWISLSRADILSFFLLLNFINVLFPPD